MKRIILVITSLLIMYQTKSQMSFEQNKYVTDIKHPTELYITFQIIECNMNNNYVSLKITPVIDSIMTMKPVIMKSDIPKLKSAISSILSSKNIPNLKADELTIFKGYDLDLCLQIHDNQQMFLLKYSANKDLITISLTSKDLQNLLQALENYKG